MWKDESCSFTDMVFECRIYGYNAVIQLPQGEAESRSMGKSHMLQVGKPESAWSCFPGGEKFC
jgi:hypothetical protein